MRGLPPRVLKALSRVLFFLCLQPAVLFSLDYQIQAGDTLYSIARRFNVTSKQLESWNNINDPTKIRVGQTILINVDPPSTPIPDQRTSSEYRAVSGDSFYSIARKNGLDVDELVAFNKLNKNSVLRVGQILLIPDSGAGVRATPAPAMPVSETKKDAVVPSTLLNNQSYEKGKNLSWPHSGERFVMNGKLPGVYIKAKEGDPIVSINSGKVVYSGPHSTLGYIVFVQDDGGFIYVYGGNAASSLRPGQEIKAGDLIGRVGLSPGINEPRVYFSLWKNGKYLDPSTAPRR